VEQRKGYTISGKHGGAHDDIMSAALFCVLAVVLIAQSENVNRGTDETQVADYAKMRTLLQGGELQ
jgi:hypothetical protein